MGTTCEIAAQMPDGRWKQIHVSYDGYVSGVGLILFRDYDTPEKVTALMSHGTGAVQLCTDPSEMTWDEWHPAEGFTFEELAAQHHFDTSGLDAAAAAHHVEHEECPGYLGLYVHAHGRWAAPRTTDMLRAFVETGDCADVLTRELLIEEGASEEELSGEKKPFRPINVHRGVLSVRKDVEDGEEVALMSFAEAGRDGVWDLVPHDDFQGVVGLDENDTTLFDLDGRTVEITSGTVMVSSSFGPEGSDSQSVMTVRRIAVVDPQPAPRGARQ